MPPIKAYGMARRLVTSRGASLVEVETEDGVIGIGEAWGPAKAAAGYLEVIRDEFIGSEVYDHGHVWSRITSGMYHLGLQNQMTGMASCINIALHNVSLSPHVWGGPVGLAAALHFMAALPDYPHTDHPPYPRMVEYDVGENP